MVARPVAAAGQSTAIAAAVAAAAAAVLRDDAVLEQPAVQVLVVASGQEPPPPAAAAATAIVAANVHAPRRVPDARQPRQQVRIGGRVPVPAVVGTVAPDQLVTRPVAPDPCGLPQ